MRKMIGATAFGATLLICAPASANLLANGDFESAPLTNQENFLIGSFLNQWITWAPTYYALTTAASIGGATDDYAKHNTNGGGGDQKLVQFISGAGITPGSLLQLTFDYLYNIGTLPSYLDLRVSIIGIDANRNFVVYGGTGADGLDNNNGDAGVAPPDVLLAQATFARNTTWDTDNLLSATTTRSFFALGVVVQSGCDAGPTACAGIRGFDNFELNRIPEPGSFALLALGGLGLLGVSRARRRN